MVPTRLEYGDFVILVYKGGFSIFHGDAAEWTYYSTLVYLVVLSALVSFIFIWALPRDALPFLFPAATVFGSAAMLYSIHWPSSVGVVGAVVAMGAILSLLASIVCTIFAVLLWAVAHTPRGQNTEVPD